MEIKVIEEKENPFLKRKEVQLSVNHLGISTPAKKDVSKELGEKYGVDESQVIVDYIFSKKGIGESFVSAKILKEKPKIPAVAKTEVKEGEAVEAQASEAT